MSIYAEIRSAIAAKQAIRIIFKGESRDVCPHAIGTKNGREQALVYQFAGYSKTGLPPDGEWRCIRTEDVTRVEILGERWHTGHNHSRPQTCVDRIDLEVAQ